MEMSLLRMKTQALTSWHKMIDLHSVFTERRQHRAFVGFFLCFCFIPSLQFKTSHQKTKVKSVLGCLRSSRAAQTLSVTVLTMGLKLQITAVRENLP